MPPIVLASSSPYRKALLARLNLPFTTCSPEVDEAARPGETPTQQCERLSRSKAQAISCQQPEAIVIGSDQIAAIDGAVLGKPGNHARAVQQLSQCNGRQVDFFTGLCVQQGSQQHFHLAHTQVQFRQLTPAEIHRYVTIEAPFDCAGSFKAEGLGICLFDAISSCDPSDLIGLPLIALSQLLRQFGVNPLLEAG